MSELKQVALAVNKALGYDAEAREGIVSARAALLAIRELSAELAGDAYRTIIGLKGESETVLAREVFRAMIDAALAEKG